jgi:hypothetical protein
VRMAKITAPTTAFPWTTTRPNASITRPASPRNRIKPRCLSAAALSAAAPSRVPALSGYAQGCLA